MNKIIIHDTARADLKSISTYSRNQWGPQKRNVYLSKIDAVIQRIAKSPKTGLVRDHVRKGYLSVKAGRHVIFYREIENGIEIMRILHESMDLLRQMRD